MGVLPSKVVVRTFLCSGTGECTGIEQARPVFGRGLHVQGAVELGIDGAEVLTRAEVDTIDALWSLLLTCLGNFLESGHGVLRFPERAYSLTFERAAGRRVVLRFAGPNAKRSASGGEREVMDALLSGAAEFFRAVLASSPRDEWGYRRDLAAALALREGLPER
ncbi:hypothetical protein [Streptomyces termitum]|uniref:hypothetical protein n=1 Tax=Streptomyces termitum TaxID=67368 RepID=UPI0033B7F386